MTIPSTHQTLMPYLIVDNAEALIDFAKKVFGANITLQGKNEDGSIGHCEMQIGGCTIMFSNSTPNWTARNADFFIYVVNADETFQLAKDNGASVIMELANQAYGRSGGVKDTSGNIWWITSVN